MSLRWRIAIGFALVALATAAVIAIATPPIVTQGFSDYDYDNDGAAPQPTLATLDQGANDDNEGGAAAAAAITPAPTQQPAPAPAPGPGQGGAAEQATIMRLIAAAVLAAAVASLLGLIGAGRLVRPLTQLEDAATGLARGDLTRRSGLAGRSDEFGQLGRTFDSMAKQLEEAEETRRRFLQDAAHELKTPLAVIDATSSAILDGVYKPEKRHIETMRDQSRVLARIVDDLRTISLAEGGHLPLERRRLDVQEVLTSVAAGFEARARAGSVKLQVDAPAALAVDADPDRLRQIVGALVDNALRHTPEAGSIGLRAFALADGGPGAGPVASRSGAPVLGRSPAPRLIRIVVEDTGLGFAPEAVSRVFERFYQADPSRSRGSGTSGLGLSIVRALVEAHGGFCGAENRSEGGARLWVDLPAAVPSDARARQGGARGGTIE